jgi:ketosteroid isomerase-like protein
MTITTTVTTDVSAVDLAAARRRNEDTWAQSSKLLYARDIDAYASYWTEDGSYIAALPVPGLPAVVTGREALHATFSALVAAAQSIAVHDVHFHQTDNPDVAIVEEQMVAELADGSLYENRFIIRATFRDGLIAELLEYYGQFAHADLLRRLGIAG